MASVIRESMDKAHRESEEKLKEKLAKGEKLYPNFDGRTWTRDCLKELETPIEGKITGEIPKWLSGVLIRNGPGRFTFGNDLGQHLFDGQALLHKFQIQDGTATYQCKFIMGNAYKADLEGNRIVYSEFGTRASSDPCHSLFQRFTSVFQTEKVTDNANIGIYPLADQIYAYGEFPYIFKINKNLETEERVNAFKMFNIIHHSSHPQVEADGSVYNIGLSVSKGAKYCVVFFPKTKKGEKAQDEDVFQDACIKAEVPSRWPFHPGYMHSFGITENYFVIIEQPYCLSAPARITTKFTRGSALDMLKWFENEKTAIHVVSRETGQVVRSFSAEGFFYFHTINQFEEDNQVILDMCVYRDGKLVNALGTQSLRGAQNEVEFAKKVRARAVRFVLPLGELDKTGENMVTLKNSKAKATSNAKGKVQVECEFLSELYCEMPRINNPLYTGKKYRYFYSSTFNVTDDEQPVGLMKVDTETKTSKIWKGGNVLASEPVFVQSPSGQDEDDGLILASILSNDSNEENKVTLVVIDAKEFNELARVEFTAPSPVPFTFHGWFFNDP